MLRENPCRYCVDKRTATCHSTCEEYIEWRDELDEINAVIREYVMIDMCAYYRRQRAIDYCRRRGEKIFK